MTPKTIQALVDGLLMAMRLRRIDQLVRQGQRRQRVQMQVSLDWRRLKP